MPADPPPRRKWHLTRWLIVLIVATLSWSGWRAYTFRDALAQAKALGWPVQYTDPVETIGKNWKAAFKKATWLDGVTFLLIPTGRDLEQNLVTVHRLNPIWLIIGDAATLRDLASLKPLTRLKQLDLDQCTGLTNVDALKNLASLKNLTLRACTGIKNVEALKHLFLLEDVSLINCTGLTNVDALKNLSALGWVNLTDCTGLTSVDGLTRISSLQIVKLNGCSGLTPESVAAFRAAHPNADIYEP